MRSYRVLLMMGIVSGFCAAAACRGRSLPEIPKDKVDIADGWIRLKQSRLEPGKLGAIEGESEYMILAPGGFFTVAKADFQFDRANDYHQIRMGAKVSAGPPDTKGPPTWYPTSIQPAKASECGGKPTTCLAGWQGYGVLACQHDGTVIGICGGGWTGERAPK